jgi:phosphonate transport system substrate-binding protein
VVLFGLPPTPSRDAARAHAPALQAALSRRVPDIVVEVAATYGALGDDLLKQRYALAWAPPIVCARVEMGGGSVALRAVRGGVTSYRAGLVCRHADNPDLSRASELVAAWVDEDSAAGYLLARSWLKMRKIDAVHGFKRALFVGSYLAALQAVAHGDADLASIYISGEGSTPHSTLDEVEDALRDKLRVFATTGETQTDGIVIAPAVADAVSQPIVAAVVDVAASADGAAVLRRLLSCDELRAAAGPRRPTSNALHELLAMPARSLEPR